MASQCAVVFSGFDFVTAAANLNRHQQPNRSEAFEIFRAVLNRGTPENYRGILASIFYKGEPQVSLRLLSRFANSDLMTEMSPSVLLAAYHGTRILSEKLTNDALLLRIKLQVEDRMTELLNSPDRDLARQIDGMMKSFGIARSADERQIMREALLATEQGSEIRRSRISFIHKGQRQTLEVTEQQEIERRTQVPNEPFDALVNVQSAENYRYFSRRVRVQQTEDIPRILLDRYYSNSRMSEKFRLRPLGSTRDHYHSGIHKSHEKVGIQEGRFVETLTNLLPLEKRIGDSTKASYTITHQRETATYYDSNDSRLEQRGYALRVKEWSPVGETADANAPRAKAIFLKKSNGNDQLFTNRDEVMVRLPEGADLSYIQSAMNALLASRGITDVNVEARTLVHNDRYGFNITYKGEIKIGYIVVDSFTNEPVTAAASQPRVFQPARQWELEILPQWLPLVRQNQEAFGQWAREMEESFRGTPDTRPKYLNQTAVLSQGLSSSLQARASQQPTQLRFSVKEMVSGSRGDDYEFNVRYLQPSEREPYRVHSFEGKLHNSEGHPIDTRGRKVSYAMDVHGQIYLDLGIDGWVQHSTFLAGEPVAAAGEIIVKDGVVEFIDNSSGHYLPTSMHLSQVVERLREIGIRVNQSAIRAR